MAEPASGMVRRFAVAFVLLSACSSGEGDVPSPSTPLPGDRIAFTCDRSICTISPSGENQVQLTEGSPGVQDTMPDWSPDRSRIVFARQVSPTQGAASADIFVVGSNGSGERRLTSSDSTEVQPRWSPDGTKILFANDQMGSFDLWVMDADGRNPIQLTDEPTHEYDAVWSPDGDRIAYTVEGGSLGSGTSAATWTMSVDGSDRALLVEDRGSPAYSPDGSLIVLGGLVFVEATTGQMIRTLYLGETGDIFAEPAWSPDGKWIVYRRGPFGPEAEIYLVSADGSLERRVTDDHVLDGFPDWS